MSEVTTASGLIYEDITVGSGETAGAGMHVTVHYTGWLTDGVKFDSSKDRGDPFSFPLGAGHVIRGWDEGVRACRWAACASSPFRRTSATVRAVPAG